MAATYLTSSESASAEVSQFAGDTQMGPVHPVSASDLYGPGAATSDQRYTLSPRERDAWQFSVDQAHLVMGQCTAATDPHTAESGPFDGPYNADTIAAGVPMYGLAGG